MSVAVDLSGEAWDDSMGWTKTLFLSNRYLAILISAINVAGNVPSTLPFGFCKFTQYWQTITGAVQVFLAESILCHRLNALYQQDKRIKFGMLTLLFATTAASVGIIGNVIQNSEVVSPGIPDTIVCYAVSSKGGLLWALWIPDVVFETTAFACASRKTYEHVKEMRRLSCRKPLGQRLVEAMYQDSLLYFICIFILFMGNCLIFKLGSGASGIGQILQGPTQAILSIIGSRMLLHTREIADKFPREMNTPGNTGGGEHVEEYELTSIHGTQINISASDRTNNESNGQDSGQSRGESSRGHRLRGTPVPVI